MSDHVVELLPWYINGRLSVKDTARVTVHLEKCQKCASELALQEQIHTAINTSSKVEIAPQPSFNKLWDRIVADEFPGEQPQQPSRTSIHSTKESGLQSILYWLRSHWMPLMLSTQSVAIVALAGMVFLSHGSSTTSPPASNTYRTVTTTTQIDLPIIHVVFDDAIRLADIKDILFRSNLQVASGPTATGVYSLSPVGRSNDFDARTVAHTLRNDPRIRFAEVSHE